jgi:hypothetical protein
LDIRKIFGPLLAALLVMGVGAGIWHSAQQKQQVDAQARLEAQTISVRGLVGSEKADFYRDPRVQALLLRHGIKLSIDTAGSREIAQRTDLKNYDFGHPAGSPAALMLQKAVGAKTVYPTFYTPMVVGSWRKLVPMLEANGLVKEQNGTFYLIDMPRLLQLIAAGKRWHDLKGNDSYDTNKSILVASTDVRKSNSAAMYLALASYILNDGNVVQSQTEIDKVLPVVSSLFLRQGFQESSSAGPFDDYVGMGMGKAPLVMIYEAQLLEYQSKLPAPNPDMVMLYPEPTVFAKHVLVPFDAKGEQLGQLFDSDPELKKLAAEYGFRTSDNSAFRLFLQQHKLSAPDTLVDVIDPPSYENLERMITAIEAKYQ